MDTDANISQKRTNRTAASTQRIRLLVFGTDTYFKSIVGLPVLSYSTGPASTFQWLQRQLDFTTHRPSTPSSVFPPVGLVSPYKWEPPRRRSDVFWKNQGAAQNKYWMCSFALLISARRSPLKRETFTRSYWLSRRSRTVWTWSTVRISPSVFQRMSLVFSPLFCPNSFQESIVFYQQSSLSQVTFKQVLLLTL